MRSTRAFSQALFAELATRILAFGIDLVLILLMGSFIEAQLFSFDLFSSRRIPYVFLLLVYFSISWSSPLRATPAQFLFKMRVLHQSGHPMTPQGAMVRSVLVVALWEFTVAAIKWANPTNTYYVAAAVGVLLFFTAVTAHRQGIHDLLVRSVVINRRSIRTPEQKQAMFDFLASADPLARKHRRPSVFSMISNAFALAVPILLLSTVAQVTNDKDLRARTDYAVRETKGLQIAVTVFYEETASWPTNEAELGAAVRHDYPDGGFYELQDDGVIRIHFEIKPELRHGSIVLSPNTDGDEMEWDCRVEGDIDPRHTPYNCR